MKTDVVVIGGGASGLIAALNAAEQGASVLLLDKNATWQKTSNYRKRPLQSDQ